VSIREGRHRRAAWPLARWASQHRSTVVGPCTANFAAPSCFCFTHPLALTPVHHGHSVHCQALRRPGLRFAARLLDGSIGTMDPRSVPNEEAGSPFAADPGFLERWGQTQTGCINAAFRLLHRRGLLVDPSRCSMCRSSASTEYKRQPPQCPAGVVQYLASRTGTVDGQVSPPARVFGHLGKEHLAIFSGHVVIRFMRNGVAEMV